MKAEEIIPATHRLEHSGMTRNEAEAVISELQKVTAPLATKDDLAKLEQSIRSDMQSIRSDMESIEQSIRSDVESIEQSMATKDDLAKLERSMATKVDVAKMETRLFRSLAATMLAIGALILSVLRFFPPA